MEVYHLPLQNWGDLWLVGMVLFSLSKVYMTFKGTYADSFLTLLCWLGMGVEGWAWYYNVN